MLSALLVAAFSAAIFFGAWHGATSLHPGAATTRTTSEIQGGTTDPSATPTPTVTPGDIFGGGPPGGPH
jgi:hypothetical protein